MTSFVHFILIHTRALYLHDYAFTMGRMSLSLSSDLAATPMAVLLWNDGGALRQLGDIMRSTDNRAARTYIFQERFLKLVCFNELLSDSTIAKFNYYYLKFWNLYRDSAWFSIIIEQLLTITDLYNYTIPRDIRKMKKKITLSRYSVNNIVHVSYVKLPRQSDFAESDCKIVRIVNVRTYGYLWQFI